MKRIRFFWMLLLMGLLCKVGDISSVDSEKVRFGGNYPYVSGDVFKNFCDFVFDDFNLLLNTEEVKDGDAIFVKNQDDFLGYFFEKIHPKIKVKYILVTHNDLYKNSLNKYKKYLDDENIFAWFGKNMDIIHPKAFPIPLGVGNKPYLLAAVNNANRCIVKKDKLLCCNFSIGSQKERRGSIRKKVADIFKNKKFCYKSRRKPFEQYIEDLARSKFVLSPEGNGIDCLRTWESLLVGSIPIVTKSCIDFIFEGLPILIIDDWNQVTEDFLVAKYEKMSHEQYNMEKLYADYWLNKIQNMKDLAINSFLDKNLVVNFHQSMSRSKNYKENFANQDPKWQKVKSLFEDNFVNNSFYSEKPKIPKIIHQIWLGGNGKLPQKYHKLQKTWIDKHPDWEYKLWTEKEIDDFGLIRRDIYDNTSNYGAKSDIVRYEILYRIGGLYIDTDFECLKSFDVFHHMCDFYAGIAYDKNVEIFCGLIGAAPGHPVLRHAIYDMQKKTKLKESANDVLQRTSVYHFTRSFFKGIDKHLGPSVVLPITYFYPWPHYFKGRNTAKEVAKWINRETFANHHWHVAWK